MAERLGRRVYLWVPTERDVRKAIQRGSPTFPAAPDSSTDRSQNIPPWASGKPACCDFLPTTSPMPIHWRSCKITNEAGFGRLPEEKQPPYTLAWWMQISVGSTFLFAPPAVRLRYASLRLRRDLWCTGVRAVNVQAVPLRHLQIREYRLDRF